MTGKRKDGKTWRRFEWVIVRVGEWEMFEWVTVRVGEWETLRLSYARTGMRGSESILAPS
jgi:hypothetical protein